MSRESMIAKFRQQQLSTLTASLEQDARDEAKAYEEIRAALDTGIGVDVDTDYFTLQAKLSKSMKSRRFDAHTESIVWRPLVARIMASLDYDVTRDFVHHAALTLVQEELGRLPKDGGLSVALAAVPLPENLPANQKAAYLLWCDSVASMVEGDDEFNHLREKVARSQEDILDTIHDTCLEYDIDFTPFLDVKTVDETISAINKLWEGKLTWEELAKHDEKAAGRLFLALVGHGVSHQDEPESIEWMKAQGLSEDQIDLEGINSFESPYDGAYSFLTKLDEAVGGEGKEAEAAAPAQAADVEAPQNPEVGKLFGIDISEDEAKQKLIAYLQKNKEEDFNGADISKLSDEEIAEEVESSWDKEDRYAKFKIDGIEFCLSTDRSATYEAEDNVESFFEDELESAVDFKKDWVKDYLYVGDTNKRLYSNEEAEYLYSEDSMDDKEVLKEAEKGALDEAEAYGNLDEDSETYDKDAEKLIQQMRETLAEKKAEEISEALSDPYKYFVKDQGMYSDKDFAEMIKKGGLVNFDAKKAAKYVVQVDGWVNTLNRWDGETYFDLSDDLVMWRE